MPISAIGKDYLHCMRSLAYELKTQLYWLRITKRPVYLLFDLLAQCTSPVASFHAKPNGDGVDIQGKMGTGGKIYFSTQSSTRCFTA